MASRGGEGGGKASPRFFAPSTSLLVLMAGLAVFVVALNIRHYPTMCNSQSDRDESLLQAAMERRIRTLEKDLLQNGLLTTKVLKALDKTFKASTLFSVEELKIFAQTEAAEIAVRRARQPPPPMSEYARSRVSAAVGAGTIQEVVHEAIYASETPSIFVKPQGEGWDWDPVISYEDDFLGESDVETILPAVLDISDEKKNRLCLVWRTEHEVVPGIDWGTLPEKDQKRWVTYRCDETNAEIEGAEGGVLKEGVGGGIDTGTGTVAGGAGGEGGNKNEAKLRDTSFAAWVSGDQDDAVIEP